MVSPGSWVLRLEERESQRGIHPSVRPCIQPHSRPDRRPGAGESRKGGWWGRGEAEGERERPHEYTGKVRVPSARVDRLNEDPLACVHDLGNTAFQAGSQQRMAPKSKGRGRRETDAGRRLAISQKTL